MNRSKFLVLSALAAASIAVPSYSCSGPDPELDKKLSLPQTLSQIVDEKTIIKIGKTYGQSNADEYSLKALEKLLVQDSDGKTLSGNSPAPDVYAFLDNKIKNDYESGNTKVVEGWVLSATEAQQCALLSLIATTK